MKRYLWISANDRAWRWRGNLYSSARTSADKRTKVQNKYKSSSKNFQPGLLMNSEQKGHEMHVSPAIAKPTVTCRLGSHVEFALRTFSHLGL